MKVKKFSIRSFVFELIIVFVGVYGAFELNRYQERQREQKIKENYFRSFYSELTKLSAEIKLVQGIIDRRVNQMDSATISGNRPDLKPLNLYFGSEMLITRAGFNDDVFTQLSSELTSSLSGGFDFVQIARTKLHDFNQTCRLHLISSEPLEFYDANNQLKPQFEWYPAGLNSIKRTFDELAKMINEGAIPATRQVIDDLY